MVWPEAIAMLNNETKPAENPAFDTRKQIAIQTFFAKGPAYGQRRRTVKVKGAVTEKLESGRIRVRRAKGRFES